MIRNSLDNGEISLVNKLLGRKYSIIGEVVSGEGIGREISFPTANIAIDTLTQKIPQNGVYCVNVYIKNSCFRGMCNIGTRPTFSTKSELSFEVHLFNFSNLNLYGKNIKVEFVDYVRNEIKFNSKHDLENQLNKDRDFCNNILN